MHFIFWAFFSSLVFAAPCEDSQVYLESVESKDQDDYRYTRVIGEIPPRCMDQRQLENLVADVRLKLETCGRFEDINLEIVKGSAEKSYRVTISATPIDLFYFGARLGALTTAPMRSLDKKKSDQANGLFYGGYLGSLGFGKFDTGFDFDTQYHTLRYKPTEMLNGSDELFLTAMTVTLNVVQPFADVRNLTFGLSSSVNNKTYRDGDQVTDVTTVLTALRLTARKDFYSLSPVLRVIATNTLFRSPDEPTTQSSHVDRWIGIEGAYKSRNGLVPADIGSFLEFGAFRRVLDEDVKMMGFVAADTQQALGMSFFAKPKMEWVVRNIESDLYSDSTVGLEFHHSPAVDVFSGIDLSYTQSHLPRELRHVISAELSHSRVLFGELSAKFSLMITNSNNPDASDLDPRGVQK